RHRADVGRRIADTGVADAADFRRNTLDHGRGTRLFTYFRVIVAAEQGDVLEVTIGARGRVAAIERDRAIGPVAGQADITPSGDTLVEAAGTGRREDRVNLLQRKALDRVVLVHKHAERIDGAANRGRCVAVTLFEALDF